jgi:hypothetical protein
MKQIVGYVSDYFQHTNRLHFCIISVILSLLIWVNYHYNLNATLFSDPSFFIKFFRNYALFASVFIVTWLSWFILSKKRLPDQFGFYLLLLFAPAIFAIKVSLQINYLISLNDSYLQTVLQWPLKAFATLLGVFILRYWTKTPYPFAGLGFQNFDARPYLVMLMLMFPLLLIAGQGEDFQKVYPKLHIIQASMTWYHGLFFELCYGIDFFTIELFFRGFLVLVFIKYAGKESILPMAAFYCTIHFGKPVAECISSYFGGLILGAVVYNTRSIWGGLIVHLGIAWMMEVIGVIF